MHALKTNLILFSGASSITSTNMSPNQRSSLCLRQEAGYQISTLIPDQRGTVHSRCPKHPALPSSIQPLYLPCLSYLPIPKAVSQPECAPGYTPSPSFTTFSQKQHVHLSSPHCPSPSLRLHYPVSSPGSSHSLGCCSGPHHLLPLSSQAP